MMWFLLVVNIALTEPVLLHAQGNRLILKGGNHPCEGHIEVYHKGKWGYVGDKGWTKSTEEVVCRTTRCGTPVEDSYGNAIRSSDSLVWLNEVACNGTEKSLFDCQIPGWNVSFYKKDMVKQMGCSHKVKISLDGFQCAGAVQYSIDGKTRSGYFCDTNWGKKEADFLCESQNCGKSKTIPKLQWMVWNDFQNSNKLKIKCSDIGNVEDNLWQCVSQGSASCPTKPASVICEKHKRLQLRGNPSNVCSGNLEMEEDNEWKPAKDLNISPDVWCKQMYCGSYVNHTQSNSSAQLNCTDNIQVSLQDKGKPSKCYGTVHVTVNGLSHPVCGSNWNKKAGEVVCKELNCGRAVSVEERNSAANGIMSNADCSGSEASLWHCWGKRDKTPFLCSSTAFVVCEGSVDVRLMDGSGNCTGRVEIQHEGQWKLVSDKGWTDENSNTVCRQLNCGKRRSISRPEKVPWGSGDFLTKNLECRAESKDISECLKDSPSSNNDLEDRKAVTITCEEHKVVFLSDSCSGSVGIEHGNKTYWLSGSAEMWNQDTANIVCQQMHCGNASDVSSINAGVVTDVWNQTLNCSPRAKSLFECEATTVSPGANSTIATVKCSGSIVVNLTNECWGYVDVHMYGLKGGVCANTWTDEQSVMLCKNLGCGETTLAATRPHRERKVIFKSLHATKKTTKLSQCNFVKSDDNSCNKNPAYVVCSGSVQTRFSISRDRCSGKLEVLYEGSWLSVCTDAFQDVATQNAICKKLQCGQVVKKIDYFGPKAKNQNVISKLQCSENDAQLCNITSIKTSCVYADLQCSNQAKISLSSSCRGEVYVHTDGETRRVSSEGWTQTEAQTLCQDLQCGNIKSIKNSSTSQKEVFWDRTFSCAGVEDPKNIWACEKKKKPTERKQLIVDCEDKSKISLLDRCQGKVKIDNTEVCSTNWDDSYSHLVCHEQGCSNAIVGASMSAEPEKNADYYHVSCDHNHDSLNQCRRVKGRCDGKLVSVSCVNNVEFNTTEKCGGQIKIKYDKSWENVCPLTLTSEFKNKLCQKLACGAHDLSKQPTKTSSDPTVKQAALTTTLKCTDNHVDIKYCVVAKSCAETRPAEIYCKKYEKRPVEPPGGPTPLQIILGVGIFLIVVILVIILVRVWMIRRARNAMKGPSQMMSQTEEDFESGEFENIKENEMEEFSHGGFRYRSEAKVTTENDAQSSSSLPYDDIEEMVETQPLTSEGAAAAGSPGNYYNDGVTYEVEDPQDNYDDVEASPEGTQTAAEVHCLQNIPECGGGAPPDLVPGEDDYLVPGQDG